MTVSMTAFCRHQSEHLEGSLVWEIRSVNHRYLDIHFKLPEQLRSLEPGCRDRINKKLNRGRVDVTLKFEPANDASHELVVNEATLGALARSLEQVKERIPEADAPNPCEILRWPGVLEDTNPDIDGLMAAAMRGLDEAIKDLIENRQREGMRMGQLIGERIIGARDIVSGLRNLLTEIEMDMKQRWQRRLDELGDQVDPARLNQELALLLTRTDVSEELDRLDTHFDEVDRTLSQSKAAGRRLDFLMQELNREANTLGAKSIDLRNTNASVELKVLIDQMREQVQNIE